MIGCATEDRVERKFGGASECAVAFKRVRKELRISQVKMAKLLGIGQVAVSNTERGLTTARPDTALKLRDLAFANRLDFAHELFPEIDLGDRCPTCGK